MMPLSRTIHTEMHSRGLVYMALKYPNIKIWLLNKGWEYDDYVKKWRHKDAYIKKQRATRLDGAS